MQKRLQPFSLQVPNENSMNNGIFHGLMNRFKLLKSNVLTYLHGSTPIEYSKLDFSSELKEQSESLFPEPESGTWDTLVYPTVQLGFANVSQDQFILTKLINSLNFQHITFASGYFNLTHEYSKLVAESTAEFDFLTASPEANGFLGGSGLSGHIPYVYIYLTKVFHSMLSKHRRLEKVHIHEYQRKDWTFHAKGLWVSDNKYTTPHLTVIGSSNFGARSVYRDLEAQATIITTNEKLMKKLDLERRAIQQYSIPVSAETFKTPRYRTSFFINIVSPIIKRLF